jgi:molybdopterin synthase catalytic subunit
MTVNVVVFAGLRERLGTGRIEFSLTTDATVATLKQEILQQYPQLQDLLPHCAVSVDHQYAGDEAVLADGCEVGLIPPVSGG